MKKYAVYFESGSLGKSYIHVFAVSPEAAASYVRMDGIGFNGRIRIFPDKITHVEEIPARIPVPMPWV